MKATLVINRHAGSTEGIDGDELAGVLREAGYDAEARFTADLDELDHVLNATEGLVVSVGGDGTLRAIALRMLDRDRPLALVPLGTANNVAASLGLLKAGKPVDLLRRLANPRRRSFDVGKVCTVQGEEYFLEVCGVGLYADLLADYRPDAGKNVRRALESTQEVIVGYEPWALEVAVNGEIHHGPFVLAAVMNTPRMGLRIPLAPNADPGDGSLDLVLIRHQKGKGLLGYASRLARGTLEKDDDVTRIPIQHCRIVSEGSAFHVDERVVEPREAAGRFDMTIDVLPAALELWLPSEET